MKVLLDEGVPRTLASALRAFGLDADPFDTAWTGLRNGTLIRRVEAAGYSVLLTNDKNMAFQQSLKGAGVAVVALPLNRRTLVLTRAADIADTIRRAVPGASKSVRAPPGANGSAAARSARPRPATQRCVIRAFRRPAP